MAKERSCGEVSLWHIITFNLIVAMAYYYMFLDEREGALSYL